jgi:hypothetical protein
MTVVDCTPVGEGTLGFEAPAEGAVLLVDLDPGLLPADPERVVGPAVARVVEELQRVAGDWVSATIILRAHAGTPAPVAAALFEAARAIAQVATLEELGVRCNVVLYDAEGSADAAASLAYLGAERAAFTAGLSIDLRGAA